MRDFLSDRCGVWSGMFAAPRDYLANLPQHPFLSGMGSSLSIGGNYYRRSVGAILQDDYAAIRSDWCMVGQDIGRALRSNLP